MLDFDAVLVPSLIEVVLALGFLWSAPPARWKARTAAVLGYIGLAPVAWLGWILLLDHKAIGVPLFAPLAILPFAIRWRTQAGSMYSPILVLYAMFGLLASFLFGYVIIGLHGFLVDPFD